MSAVVNTAIFVGVAKIIVVGTFGASLVQALRRDGNLEESFIRLVGAFLGIFFYREFFDVLSMLSNGLTGLVESATGGTSVFDQIGEAQKAANNAGAWNGISQALKVGVWGIVASLIELIFILSYELLMAARDVLWQLCIVLFPLAASLCPYFPSITLNLMTYSLEIALWLPVLSLIDFVVSVVSHEHMIGRAAESVRPDFGLPILAVQLMSIILIFSIPSATNRMVSGALSGDFSAGPSGILTQVALIKTRALGAVSFVNRSKAARAATRAATALLILIAPLAQASDGGKVSLYPGFVTKVQCRGKVLVSAVGNESLVRLEPLPNEMGCGVILKAKARSGTTNLILETSTGTHRPMIEIRPNAKPSPADLLLDLGGGL